ncbi:MAG: DUF1570 domain-containing protein [Planctomycetota bacterium]|nr:MAG: DUF1570 domain-containing protein [Planctomycetota bacterium]
MTHAYGTTVQQRHLHFSGMSILLVLGLLCTSLLQASERDGPLRWRVMADQESRISFRFPFSYHIPDMYYPGVTRQRPRRQASISGEEAAGMTPEQIRDELRRRLRDFDVSQVDYDIELFFMPREQVHKQHGSIALEVIAEALSAQEAMQWEAYDYYAISEQRPQAQPRWAPENIEGSLGRNDTHTALALRYDQGVAVVVLTGAPDAHNNQAIIDSIEVMAEQRREVVTYRHGTALRGQILNADGQSIRPTNTPDGIDMREAWSIETGNYHIISNVSPRHLQTYASMMEVLYETFHQTFSPERMPPFKMEVAVWRSQGEMMRAASALGVGPMPPGVLGYFSPSQLNIMSYEYEAGTGRNTFSTLAHEASHQFLHVTCNGSAHVPTWINEGLAVYFESSQYRGGRLHIQPPHARLRILQRFYSRNNRMLRNPGDYLNHYGHIPGEQYGEVYLKTHFWLFGVRGGRERFHKYWQALRNGEDGTEAFEEHFMQDIIANFGSRQAALREVENMIVNYLGQIR